MVWLLVAAGVVAWLAWIAMLVVGYLAGRWKRLRLGQWLGVRWDFREWLRIWSSPRSGRAR